EQRQLDIAKYGDRYEYSPRYNDDVWEYRHVKVPPQLVKYLPTDRLMAEEEWRGLGVRQSLGWFVWLSIHAPEPNILLFRQ
ncbi:regulatory subunit of cyclin-dependent kinase, partial [Paraphysoderma sedebokerense]